jgi:hypothetical protein
MTPESRNSALREKEQRRLLLGNGSVISYSNYRVYARSD